MRSRRRVHSSWRAGKRAQWRRGGRMTLSTRPRPRLRLCALAMLSAGLLFAPGAAQAAGPGRVVAWGCGGFGDVVKQDGSVIAWGCGDVDYGQCTVPAAAAGGVKAIAAGASNGLALKQDGSVIAWGCGSAGGL